MDRNDIFFKCRWPGCKNTKQGRSNYCYSHQDEKCGHKSGTGPGNGPRLTEEQRQDIRNRMSRFESPKAIAKMYGVTIATVRKCMVK